MNQIATKFIKEREDCRLQAYLDGGGVWTAGWGATGPDIHAGTIWTQQQADARLLSDQARKEAAVRSLVKVALSDRQEAAIISLAFNVGEHALVGTRCLQHINAREWIPAAKEIPDFDHDNGKEVKGLLIRRYLEAALFLQGS